jgi:hypothetical protein
MLIFSSSPLGTYAVNRMVGVVSENHKIDKILKGT